MKGRMRALMTRLGRAIADFDVREKAGALSVVTIAWLTINLVFAFVVNVPRSNRVAFLNDQVMHIAGQTASKARDVDKLRPQHARVVEGNTSLDHFYDDVLSTKEKRLIGFQREIREIAGKYNINMESISYPRETYPKDKVTKLSAVMPLTGSYEGLRSFIDTIEKSENFILIEAIQLTNSREGGVILSLNIMLSTYFVDPDIREKQTPVQAKRG